MNTTLLWIGRIALLLTIVPSVLLLFGTLSLATVKMLMIIGMAVWFVAAPLRMATAPK